jgi:hypothetical protein
VHSRALLRLDWGYRKGIPETALNDVFLEFRNSVHLEVPKKLLRFSDCETSFAANPSFQSLTISASATAQISPKMLESIVRNTSLKHLTIDCHDWQYSNNIRSLSPIVHTVAVENASLESLTLVSYYN